MIVNHCAVPVKNEKMADTKPDFFEGCRVPGSKALVINF
jgi:hypothetical protein